MSKNRFGLPSQVKFCKLCVMSNQRPASSVEFKHTSSHSHTTLSFGEDGICDACRFNLKKAEIDWAERESELLELLDKHRRNDGEYDCVVPGSGGKDSIYASYILKYKYGMHPLTVTWPPTIYTEIGWKNFRNWIDVGGFDNISFNYNGKVHALLTRLAIENLLHPFQPFILGQKNLAVKLALKFNIPLVFYGENEAEYGNPIGDNKKSLRDKSFFSLEDIDNVYLSGVSAKELKEKHGLTVNDIKTYLPPSPEQIEKHNIEVHYLGYYLKWTPQENYYFSVENADFQCNPVRTEGSFTKYNSLDDKIDGFHYYTTFIKFGIGRCTYEASQEIRNSHITREEAQALVQRFDGEFPERYLEAVMEYTGLTRERFEDICDSFRSPHLWKKVGGKWRLRHTVNGTGVDDRPQKRSPNEPELSL